MWQRIQKSSHEEIQQDMKKLRKVVQWAQEWNESMEEYFTQETETEKEPNTNSGERNKWAEECIRKQLEQATWKRELVSSKTEI